ncbi:MAG: cofactor-independent phosphoglycerate mutase [Bacillota bacterium]
MKYIIIVGDGMADYPVKELGGKTPLQRARKPAVDSLARKGEMGMVRTVPVGMAPGSDTANLSVIGYDPQKYYTGRSPFEAAGMGVRLQPGDVSFRCNLVTLSSEAAYAGRTMLDYCAGEIPTAEGGELIEALRARLKTAGINFYAGISYRHLMVWTGGPKPAECRLTPPHDISGRKIEPYLPAGGGAALLRDLMEQSAAVLPRHPVNRRRLAGGLKPANSIWLWGEGTAPRLPLFREKYGLQGSVISAVDLLKGIALYAGLKPIEVAGATGDIHTDYGAKTRAALHALREGDDFVYLHIEAPDECAHRFEIENKVRAIELIDEKVVAPLLAGLEQTSEPFSILFLPDHATPLALRTHTADPVPFLIYRNRDVKTHPPRPYDEETAAAAGLYIDEGCKLMDYFLDY